MLHLSENSTLMLARLASVLSFRNVTAPPPDILAPDSPVLQTHPMYHSHHPQVIKGIDDKYLALVAPMAVYWIVAVLFYLLDVLQLPYFERRRIHSQEATLQKNRVSVRDVLVSVFFQQVVQTFMGYVVIEDEFDSPFLNPLRDRSNEVATYVRFIRTALTFLLAPLGTASSAKGVDYIAGVSEKLGPWMYWWGVPIVQFGSAMVIMDGWQYALHRYFHVNQYLYKHIHSWHHRLYAPYAFGALYNHPLEGFLLDTCGAAVSQAVTCMSTRQSIAFFAISTAKTVDDHCGYRLWWDPLQFFFFNNADYHDIHHQMAGLKFNYSQPYFIHFDHFFKTRMTRAEYQNKISKRRAPPAVKTQTDKTQ